MEQLGPAGYGYFGPNTPRPVFGTSGTTITSANVLAVNQAVGVFNQPALAATVTTTVRGDSLVSLGLNTPNTTGLRVGDLNRNGAVNISQDILPALANIGVPGAGGTKAISTTRDP